MLAKFQQKKGVVGQMRRDPEKERQAEEKMMREYEEKLAAEREKIKQQAEQDCQSIMSKANLKNEEKQKLVAEIRQREEGSEKAKDKQEKLLRKLHKM